MLVRLPLEVCTMLPSSRLSVLARSTISVLQAPHLCCRASQLCWTVQLPLGLRHLHSACCLACHQPNPFCGSTPMPAETLQQACFVTPFPAARPAGFTH